ncbi:MAG: tetratricopeptide repeat protein, partial [Vicinamibacterales bacterium]
SRAGPLDRDALQSCLEQLRRADQQLGTPESAAALAEGTGMVRLASGSPFQAAEQFQRAAAAWESLGRHYDQARALGALGDALQRAGEISAARTAFDEAITLYDTLANQLDDPDIRASFLNSPHVRDIRPRTP